MSDFEDIFEKSEHINQVISSFRRIFLDFNVCTLITNQITDIPGDMDLKVSALGLTLENNINVKLYLEKTLNPGERCMSLKKSLFTPLSKEYFTIAAEGIMGPERDKTQSFLE